MAVPFLWNNDGGREGEEHEKEKHKKSGHHRGEQSSSSHNNKKKIFGVNQQQQQKEEENLGSLLEMIHVATTNAMTSLLPTTTTTTTMTTRSKHVGIKKEVSSPRSVISDDDDDTPQINATTKKKIGTKKMKKILQQANCIPRKRIKSYQVLLQDEQQQDPLKATIVPQQDEQQEEDDDKVKLTSSLSDDVLCHVISFLDRREGQTLQCVNPFFNELIRDGTFLWYDWSRQSWPTLDPNIPFASQQQQSFVQILNQGQSIPTRLDIQSTVLNQVCQLSSSSNKKNRRTITNPPRRSNHIVVQYTGTVGLGDRSVRTVEPLARPLLHCPGCNTVLRGEQAVLQAHANNNSSTFRMMNQYRFIKAFRLCRPDEEEILNCCPHCCTNSRRRLPFTVPFVSQNHLIQLLPRMISYFEITILSNNNNSPIAAVARSNSRPSFDAPPQVSDCIAIGVSRQEFKTSCRMPGWDEHSFGYHGDDGGIFHASGDLLAQYGPSFGGASSSSSKKNGDVVGCGINYTNGTIFFTLNGVNLGPAFACRGLEQTPWFPTVGIDSSCPIQFNFMGPFSFDLQTFISKQQHGQQQQQQLMTPIVSRRQRREGRWLGGGQNQSSFVASVFQRPDEHERAMDFL